MLARLRVTAALMLAAGAVLAASPAHADVIVDRPVTPFMMAFGSVVEIGQVFTPPEDQDVLSEVTVTAGSNAGDTTTVSIRAWDPVTSQPVGPVLFESGVIEFTETGEMQTETVPVPHLSVDPEAQYVLSFSAERVPYVLGHTGAAWRELTGTTWTDLNVSLAHRMVFRERPTIAELTPNSAAPGSEVTITGTGFDDTTEVFFGDAAAEFTIVSDTEITAVVPALEAGSTVMVGVVSDGLTSAESPTALFSVPAAPVTPTPAPAQPGPTQPAAPGTHGETLPAVGSSASAQLALLAVGFGALGLALVSRAGRAGTARTRS